MLTNKKSSYIMILVTEEVTRKCASGSVGGARPCQGRGRGFESRLALLCFHKKKGISIGYPFLFVKEEPERVLPTFEFFASLRSLHNQDPLDLVQRLAQKTSSVGAEHWSTGPIALSRAFCV